MSDDLEQPPIDHIEAIFIDDMAAQEVADALNRWFKWIVSGGDTDMPAAFEPFGVETANYAWSLDEDVDWTMGPHARAVGSQVRIAIATHDTQHHVAGLLRKLGATSVRMERAS